MRNIPITFHSTLIIGSRILQTINVYFSSRTLNAFSRKFLAKSQITEVSKCFGRLNLTPDASRQRNSSNTKRSVTQKADAYYSTLFSFSNTIFSLLTFFYITIVFSSHFSPGCNKSIYN